MNTKAAVLLMCVMPTGISYSDKSREVNGDYKRVAHLFFSDLRLDILAPRSSLVKEVMEHAAKLQARRGGAVSNLWCWTDHHLGRRSLTQSSYPLGYSMSPKEYMNALFNAVLVGLAAHYNLTPPNEGGVVRQTLLERGQEIHLECSRPFERALFFRHPERKYATLRVEIQFRFGSYRQCDIEVGVNGTNYAAEEISQMAAYLAVIKEAALIAKLHRDRFLAANA